MTIPIENEDIAALRERRDLLKEICALTERVNGTPITPQPLWTTNDLAAYWGISDSAVNAIRDSGRIKHYRIGTGAKRGRVRYKPEDVQEYMDLCGRPEPIRIPTKKNKAMLEKEKSKIFRIP